MKSVPALYLSVELLISKVMQLQKTPKCGILAPSELSLSQFLSFFSITVEALPPATELLELLGEAHSSSFAPELYAKPVLQAPEPRLPAGRYFWGGFKEAAGCYAK